jgi:hypothetical protein
VLATSPCPPSHDTASSPHIAGDERKTATDQRSTTTDGRQQWRVASR